MKTAAIFSGQGAQFPGMMSEQINKYKVCKDILQVADEITGRPISKLIADGPKEELNKTVNTQPCILAADLIAYFAAKEEGLNECAVAGFSVGEYAALVAAKVFTVEQAFDIVHVRAEAMDKAAPIGTGAMAAVLNKTADEVKNLCNEIEGYVVPVNYNCPIQTVVSGSVQAVDDFVLLAKSKKIRCMKLPVSAPFHCKYMDPAADILKDRFETETFLNPLIPVYMNVDGEPAGNSESIKEKLIRQVNSPVFWQRSIENMREDGVEEFIECGPGTTLTTFVKKILGA